LYNHIDEDILVHLINIIGEENVFTDKETIETYSKDETENLFYPPEVVVKPQNSHQICEILKLSNHLKIPVYPRGGGTGLSGGALCYYGGIALSIEKLNKILEIDNNNLQVVVEPGVITQTFQEKLEENGLFYPPDPASRGSCMLGGNIAENSGGPRALKYGVTKDYVLSLEAVLPSGEIINTGTRTLKNVTGYNLTQLLTGSEGTLAVITKITFKVLVMPKFRKVMLAAFNRVDDCISVVSEIFKSGVVPSALEFMERNAIKAAENHLNRKFPNSEAEAHLLIELDGNYELTIEKDIEKIYEIIEENNPYEIILAEDRNKMETLWELRRSTGEAVKSISVYKEIDAVVIRNKISDLLRGVKEITKNYNIRVVCYGHAGDGNLHVNILKDNLEDDVWRNALDKVTEEILKLTVALGGTISGEHGIGLTQKKFLGIALNNTEIELMKKIKKIFDPNNILNPGKIF